MTSFGVVTCILVLMCCCWDPSLATSLSCSFANTAIQPSWTQLMATEYWYPKYRLPSASVGIERISLSYQPNTGNTKLNLRTERYVSSMCFNESMTYDIIANSPMAKKDYNDIGTLFAKLAFVRVNSGTLAIYRSSVYNTMILTQSVYVYTSQADGDPDISAVQSALSNDCSVFNTNAGVNVTHTFACGN